MLNDCLIGTDGENTAESAIVKFIGFVLAAISIIFDGAEFVGAVFGKVADDVVEDIYQIDDLIRVFVGDGSSEDGKAWHILQVTRRRRLDSVVVRSAPEVHGGSAGLIGIHGLKV